MRGQPEYLNVKQDFLNCLKDYPEYTKTELKKLLETRFNWFDISVLDENESGLIDDTHRTINNMQQELKEDPNARIFKLDFTVREVEELLK